MERVCSHDGAVQTRILGIICDVTIKVISGMFSMENGSGAASKRRLRRIEV